MATPGPNEQYLRQKSVELADAILQSNQPQDILKITEELFQQSTNFDADLQRLHQLRDEEIARRQGTANQALIDNSRQAVQNAWLNTRFKPRYRDAISALRQQQPQRGFGRIKQAWQALGYVRKGFTKADLDRVEQEYSQRQATIQALEARQQTLQQQLLNDSTILNTTFGHISQAARNAAAQQEALLQQSFKEIAKINEDLEKEKKALAEVEKERIVLSRFAAQASHAPEQEFRTQFLDAYAAKMKQRDNLVVATSEIRLQLHDLISRNQNDPALQQSLAQQIQTNEQAILNLNTEITDLEQDVQTYIGANQNLAFSGIFAPQSPQPQSPTTSVAPTAQPAPSPAPQPQGPTLSRSQGISYLQQSANISQRAQAEQIYDHLDQVGLGFDWQQYLQGTYQKIWQFMTSGRHNNVSVISDLSKTYPHDAAGFLAVFQTNDFEAKFQHLAQGNNLQLHLQKYQVSNPAAPTDYDQVGLQKFLDDSYFPEIINRRYFEPLRAFRFPDADIQSFINAHPHDIDDFHWDILRERSFQPLVGFFNAGGIYGNLPINTNGHAPNPFGARTISELFDLLKTLDQAAGGQLDQVLPQLIDPNEFQQKWDLYVNSIGSPNFGLTDADPAKFIQFLHSGAAAPTGTPNLIAGTPDARLAHILSQQGLTITAQTLIAAINSYLQANNIQSDTIDLTNLNTNLDIFFSDTSYDTIRQQWRADSPAQIVLLLEQQNTPVLQLLIKPDFDGNAFKQFVQSRYQATGLPLAPAQFLAELHEYNNNVVPQITATADAITAAIPTATLTNQEKIQLTSALHGKIAPDEIENNKEVLNLIFAHPAINPNNPAVWQQIADNKTKLGNFFTEHESLATQSAYLPTIFQDTFHAINDPIVAITFIFNEAPAYIADIKLHEDKFKKYGFDETSIKDYLSQRTDFDTTRDIIRRGHNDRLFGFFVGGRKYHNTDINHQGIAPIGLNQDGPQSLIDLLENYELSSFQIILHNANHIGNFWKDYLEDEVGLNAYTPQDLQITRFCEYLAQKRGLERVNVISSHEQEVQGVLNKYSINATAASIVSTTEQFNSRHKLNLAWDNLGQNLDLFCDHSQLAGLRATLNIEAPAQLIQLLDPDFTATLTWISSAHFKQPAFEQHLAAKKQSLGRALDFIEFVAEIKSFQVEYSQKLKNAQTILSDQLGFSDVKVNTFFADFYQKPEFAKFQADCSEPLYQPMIKFFIDSTAEITNPPYPIKVEEPSDLYDILTDYKSESLIQFLGRQRQRKRHWESYCTHLQAQPAPAANPYSISSFLDYLHQVKQLQTVAATALDPKNTVQTLLSEYDPAGALDLDDFHRQLGKKAKDKHSIDNPRWANLTSQGLDFFIASDDPEINKLRVAININNPEQVAMLLDPELQIILAEMDANSFDQAEFAAYLDANKRNATLPLKPKAFVQKVVEYKKDVLDYCHEIDAFSTQLDSQQAIVIAKEIHPRLPKAEFLAKQEVIQWAFDLSPLTGAAFDIQDPEDWKLVITHLEQLKDLKASFDQLTGDDVYIQSLFMSRIQNQHHAKDFAQLLVTEGIRFMEELKQSDHYLRALGFAPVHTKDYISNNAFTPDAFNYLTEVQSENKYRDLLKFLVSGGKYGGLDTDKDSAPSSLKNYGLAGIQTLAQMLQTYPIANIYHIIGGNKFSQRWREYQESITQQTGKFPVSAWDLEYFITFLVSTSGLNTKQINNPANSPAIGVEQFIHIHGLNVSVTSDLIVQAVQRESKQHSPVRVINWNNLNRDLGVLVRPAAPFTHAALDIENPPEFLELLTDDPALDLMLDYIATGPDHAANVAKFVAQKTSGNAVDCREFITHMKKYQAEVIDYADELAAFITAHTSQPVHGNIDTHKIIVDGFVPAAEFRAHQEAFKFAFSLQSSAGRANTGNSAHWQYLHQNIAAFDQLRQAVENPSNNYAAEAFRAYCGRQATLQEVLDFATLPAGQPAALDYIQSLVNIEGKLARLGFGNKAETQGFIKVIASTPADYQQLLTFSHDIDQQDIRWLLKLIINGPVTQSQGGNRQNRQYRPVDFGNINPVFVPSAAELFEIHQSITNSGHTLKAFARFFKNNQVGFGNAWRAYLTAANIDPAAPDSHTIRAFFTHLNANPDIAVLSTAPETYIHDFVTTHGQPNITDPVQLHKNINQLIKQRRAFNPTWSHLAKDQAIKLFFDASTSAALSAVRQPWAISPSDVYQFLDPQLTAVLEQLNAHDYSGQLESYIRQQYAGQMPLNLDQFKIAVINFETHVLQYMPIITQFIQANGATPTNQNTASLAVAIHAEIPAADFLNHQDLFAFAFKLPAVNTGDFNDISQWRTIAQHRPQLSRFKQAYDQLAATPETEFIVNDCLQSQFALLDNSDEAIDYLINEAQNYIEAIHGHYEALKTIGFARPAIAILLTRTHELAELNQLQLAHAANNQYQDFLKMTITGTDFAAMSVNGVTPQPFDLNQPRVFFNLLQTYPVDELVNKIGTSSQFAHEWRSYVTQEQPSNGDLQDFFEYLTGNSTATRQINQLLGTFGAGLNSQQILTGIKQANPGALPWDILSSKAMAVFFQRNALVGIRQPFSLKTEQDAIDSMTAILTNSDIRTYVDFFNRHGDPVSALDQFYNSPLNPAKQNAATAQDFQNFLKEFHDQVGSYAQKIETFVDQKVSGNISLTDSTDIAFKISDQVQNPDFDQYQDSLEFIFQVSSISPMKTITWDLIFDHIADLKANLDSLTADEDYLKDLWIQQAEAQPTANEALTFMLRQSTTFLQKMRAYRQKVDAPLAAIGYPADVRKSFIAQHSLAQTNFDLEALEARETQDLLKFLVEGETYSGRALDLGADKFTPLKSSPQELFNLLESYSLRGVWKFLVENRNNNESEVFKTIWTEYAANNQPFTPQIHGKLHNFFSSMEALAIKERGLDFQSLAKGPSEYLEDLYQYFNGPAQLPAGLANDIANECQSNQPNWRSLGNKTRLAFFFSNPALDTVRQAWQLDDAPAIAQLIDPVNKDILDYINDLQRFNKDHFVAFQTNAGRSDIAAHDLIAEVRNYQQTLESYSTRLNRFAQNTLNQAAIPDDVLEQIIVAINHNIDEPQFDNTYLQSFEYLFGLQDQSNQPLLQLDDAADWQAVASKKAAFDKFHQARETLYNNPDRSYYLEVFAARCTQFNHSNELLDFVLSDQSIDYLNNLNHFAQSAEAAITDIDTQLGGSQLAVKQQVKEMIKMFNHLDQTQFVTAMAGLKALFEFEVQFISSATKRHIDFYDPDIWDKIKQHAPNFHADRYNNNKADIAAMIGRRQYISDADFTEQFFTHIVPQIERMKDLQKVVTEDAFVAYGQHFQLNERDSRKVHQGIVREFGEFNEEQLVNASPLIHLMRKISPGQFTTDFDAWHYFLTNWQNAHHFEAINRSPERQSALVKAFTENPDIYRHYSVYDRAEILVRLAANPSRLLAALKDKNPTSSEYEVPAEILTDIAESLKFLDQLPDYSARGHILTKFFEEFYPGADNDFKRTRLADNISIVNSINQGDFKIRDLKKVHRSTQVLHLARPNILDQTETWQAIGEQKQLLSIIESICPDDTTRDNLADFLRPLECDGYALVQVLSALAQKDTEAHQLLSSPTFDPQDLVQLISAEAINQQRQDTFVRFATDTVFNNIPKGIFRRILGSVRSRKKQLAQMFDELDKSNYDFNKIYRYPQVVKFTFVGQPPLGENSDWTPASIDTWRQLLSWDESRYQILADVVDNNKVQSASAAMARSDNFHPLPTPMRLTRWLFDNPDWETKYPAPETNQS